VSVTTGCHEHEQLLPQWMMMDRLSLMEILPFLNWVNNLNVHVT